MPRPSQKEIEEAIEENRPGSPYMYTSDEEYKKEQEETEDYYIDDGGFYRCSCCGTWTDASGMLCLECKQAEKFSDDDGY